MNAPRSVSVRVRRSTMIVACPVGSPALLRRARRERELQDARPETLPCLRKGRERWEGSLQPANHDYGRSQPADHGVVPLQATAAQRLPTRRRRRLRTLGCRVQSLVWLEPWRSASKPPTSCTAACDDDRGCALLTGVHREGRRTVLGWQPRSAAIPSALARPPDRRSWRDRPSEASSGPADARTGPLIPRRTTPRGADRRR